jgi:hypothetical protein
MNEPDLGVFPPPEGKRRFDPVEKENAWTCSDPEPEKGQGEPKRQRDEVSPIFIFFFKNGKKLDALLLKGQGLRFADRKEPAVGRDPDETELEIVRSIPDEAFEERLHSADFGTQGIHRINDDGFSHFDSGSPRRAARKSNLPRAADPVKGRAFGSPLTRGLKARASTAEIPPGKPGALVAVKNSVSVKPGFE